MYRCEDCKEIMEYKENIALNLSGFKFDKLKGYVCHKCGRIDVPLNVQRHNKILVLKKVK